MVYNRFMTKDKQTSLRLTPEAKRLLQQLAAKLGITQAAVIEISIRRFASAEGVAAEQAQENNHA